MGHDLGEIDPHRVAADTQSARMAGLMRRVRGGDQRLGGDAAIVQAIPAHLALFEQHDLEPELGGAGRHGKASRTGPDHHQICAEFLAGHVALSDRALKRWKSVVARESRPKATSGRRMRGSKITPRLGVCPRATTAPTPAPMPL